MWRVVAAIGLHQACTCRQLRRRLATDRATELQGCKCQVGLMLATDTFTKLQVCESQVLILLRKELQQ